MGRIGNWIKRFAMLHHHKDILFKIRIGVGLFWSLLHGVIMTMLFKRPTIVFAEKSYILDSIDVADIGLEDSLTLFNLVFKVYLFVLLQIK